MSALVLGAERVLAIFDRVALGDQLMMLRWPGKEDGLGNFIHLYALCACASEAQYLSY